MPSLRPAISTWLGEENSKNRDLLTLSRCYAASQWQVGLNFMHNRGKMTLIRLMQLEEHVVRRVSYMVFSDFRTRTKEAKKKNKAKK